MGLCVRALLKLEREGALQAEWGVSDLFSS
jgi:hypothetical protein